jgi:hypothetical protein
VFSRPEGPSKQKRQQQQQQSGSNLQPARQPHLLQQLDPLSSENAETEKGAASVEAACQADAVAAAEAVRQAALCAELISQAGQMSVAVASLLSEKAEWELTLADNRELSRRYL